MLETKDIGTFLLRFSDSDPHKIVVSITTEPGRTKEYKLSIDQNRLELSILKYPPLQNYYERATNKIVPVYNKISQSVEYFDFKNFKKDFQYKYTIEQSLSSDGTSKMKKSVSVAQQVTPTPMETDDDIWNIINSHIFNLEDKLDSEVAKEIRILIRRKDRLIKETYERYQHMEHSNNNSKNKKSPQDWLIRELSEIIEEKKN